MRTFDHVTAITSIMVWPHWCGLPDLQALNLQYVGSDTLIENTRKYPDEKPEKKPDKQLDKQPDKQPKL